MKESIALFVAVLIGSIGLTYAAIRGPVSTEQEHPVLETLHEVVLESLNPGQPGPILGLTQEQREEIHSVIRHYRDEFRDILVCSGSDASWRKLDVELTDLRENFHDDLETILDDRQLEKMEEIRSELQNGETPPLVVNGLVELAGNLFDLTPLQRIAAGEILLDAGDELMFARKNRSSIREWFLTARGILRRTDARFCEILDSEQIETFLNWKKSLREKVMNRFEDLTDLNLDVRVERMSFALDLSEQQRAELRAVLKSARRNILDGIEAFPSQDGELVIDQIACVDREIQRILDRDQLYGYERMKSFMMRRFMN